MRVLSDFHEPYDHHFGRASDDRLPAWRRFTRTDRTRREDHDLLERHGVLVPPRGILEGFPTGSVVVAYVDEWAHKGKGKARDRAGALGRFPASTYCCAYVGEPGESMRLLALGDRTHVLRYTSRDPSEWRSNVDPIVEFAVAPSDPSWIAAEKAVIELQTTLSTPLVAIDLVYGREGAWFGVDLNTAPGLVTTPILLRGPTAAREVAEAIARQFARLQ